MLGRTGPLRPRLVSQHHPTSYWDIIGRDTPRKGTATVRCQPRRRKTADGMRQDLSEPCDDPFRPRRRLAGPQMMALDSNEEPRAIGAALRYLPRTPIRVPKNTHWHSPKS
jgi:hypothetical protein